MFASHSAAHKRVVGEAQRVHCNSVYKIVPAIWHNQQIKCITSVMSWLWHELSLVVAIKNIS